MKKFILILGLLVVAGCSNKVARWENAGTLVSVRPAEQPTRLTGRMGTALGETEMWRTRVETTEGVYIVHGKINVAQVGDPVKLGYSQKDSESKNQDEPSYLNVGGQQYEVSD